MKLYDTYLKYKKDYKDSILMIESGEFYEALNDDAYILHYLLHYKILYKKRYIQLGFPKKLLQEVLHSLSDIGVMVIKNGGGNHFS